MTDREKAIKIFNTVLFFGKCDCPKEELEECLKMAIEALEQEPCEDAISRQAVEETIFAEGSCEKLDIDFAKILLLLRVIKALPSVTLQPKIDGGIRNERKTESEKSEKENRYS